MIRDMIRQLPVDIEGLGWRERLAVMFLAVRLAFWQALMHVLVLCDGDE
jgi:hypothetical protein